MDVISILPPFRYGSIPPVLPSSAADSDYRTISYSGTSPWNSTGFAYTPRYPQSYRGKIIQSFQSGLFTLFLN